MTTAPSPIGPLRAVEWALAGAAGLAGAWYSFDFGAQLGGVLMGVVAAGNGAVISALLASAALDRLLPRKRG
jgi:hypothetical protein